jgi:GTPase SAR1 family protein
MSAQLTQVAPAPPASGAPGTPSGTDAIGAAIKQLLPLIGSLGRDDLCRRLTAAGARLARPSTIVCVVGEFKQGKSSLVNGLLGASVCPVDDDLATSAITLIRHGDQPAAVVRRFDGEHTISEKVAPDEIGRWVTEQGNPDNKLGVERVDIAVPSAVLKQGLALVDTPGMGGLGAGHSAATLAFLPFADGLLFVSDASSELSQPELDFLQQASELCPTVLVVQTKIDLYPHWRRIRELNQGHLARLGVDLPMVSVSSALRLQALARKDRELNDRSGFPEVVGALDREVVRPAKAKAAERCAHDAHIAVDQVTSTMQAERSVLTDPDRLHATLATLQEAKARLEHLRGPGARWNVLVGDRLADASSSVTHDFRAGLRTISRELDERIEVLTSGTQWDELVRDLQTRVAERVTVAFVAVEDARAHIRSEVLNLFADEQLRIPDSQGRAVDVDLSDMWVDKALDEVGSKAGKRFRTGLTGVRGAYSGISMFSMLGVKATKTATGAIALLNPVTLGVGAVFGGLQLLDERKRKLAMRRQNARMQMRQFIDEVQFQVGDEVSQLIREVQRQLRDEFTEGLNELQRTYSETIRQAQESAQRNQAQAQARLQQIDALLPKLAAVTATLGGVA